MSWCWGSRLQTAVLKEVLRENLLMHRENMQTQHRTVPAFPGRKSQSYCSVITVVLIFMQTVQDGSVQRILVWALILWGIRFLMAIFVELTVTKIFLACSHSNCVHLLLRSFLLISHLRERCGWHFADRWQLPAEPGAKGSGCSDEFTSQWWEELYCCVSLHHPWIILHWGGDMGRPEGVKLERKDNQLFGQS